MEPMFIEFNGRIIKVVDKEGTKVASMSSEQELAEHSADLILLDKDPEMLLDNVYHKILNDSFAELSEEWKKSLKENALKILGFNRDSWNKGEWQVDHCNGRMSSMTSLLAEDIKKLLIDQVKPANIKLSETEKKQLISAARKDFMGRFSYEYNQAYRNQIRKLIEEQAEKDAETDIKAFLEERERDPAETLRILKRAMEEKRR